MYISLVGAESDVTFETTAMFDSSYLSLYPLSFDVKLFIYVEEAGGLTNEIARDGLILLRMITKPRYRGKHIKLDFLCDDKPGLLELGRHHPI